VFGFDYFNNDYFNVAYFNSPLGGFFAEDYYGRDYYSLTHFSGAEGDPDPDGGPSVAGGGPAGGTNAAILKRKKL
jgi:hypothetical protein